MKEQTAIRIAEERIDRPERVILTPEQAWAQLDSEWSRRDLGDGTPIRFTTEL